MFSDMWWYSCLTSCGPLSKFNNVFAMSYLQSSLLTSCILMPAFWANVSKHCNDLLPCCCCCCCCCGCCCCCCCCWLSCCWADWLVSCVWLWLLRCSSSLLFSNLICFDGVPLVFVVSLSGCFCAFSACWRLSKCWDLKPDYIFNNLLVKWIYVSITEEYGLEKCKIYIRRYAFWYNLAALSIQ